MENILKWFKNLTTYVSWAPDHMTLQDSPIAIDLEDVYNDVWNEDPTQLYIQPYIFRTRQIFAQLYDNAGRKDFAFSIIDIGERIYRTSSFLAYYMRIERQIEKRSRTCELSIEEEYFWTALTAMSGFLAELHRLCEAYNIDIFNKFPCALRFLEMMEEPTEKYRIKHTNDKSIEPQNRGRIKAIYALWNILDRSYPNVTREKKALFIQAVTGDYMTALNKTAKSTYAYNHRPTSVNLNDTEVEALLELLK